MTLHPYDRAILAAIEKYIVQEGCAPTHKHLAEIVFLSQSAVTRRINALQNGGYLKKHGKQAVHLIRNHRGERVRLQFVVEQIREQGEA